MHLLLVDGSTYIFRAYHALPPLTRKSDGLPVGCVSGFCNMLFKLTEDMKGDDAPTHMAVIFDHKGKTFRDDFYPAYKAQRPPAPEDLVPQFPLTRAATRAFGISCIEMEGWEADDIIATYACQAKTAGGKVTIVSTDKDLMQLVEADGSIRMLDTLKNKWIGVEEVFEKFGVTPDKVIEVQSLAGDSVDNVPGVPGIGYKTAAELINTYGNLETLLERAGEIKQNKRRESLIEHAESARISKRLVTLEQAVPVELPLDALAREPISGAKLIPFLKAMEFTTILKRISGLENFDPDAYEADPELRSGGPAAAEEKKTTSLSVAKAKLSAPQVPGTGPTLHAQEMHEKIKAIPVNYDDYEIVTTVDQLTTWIARIVDKGLVSVDTETTGLDPQSADLVGVCLSTEPGNGCYIPVGHSLGAASLLDAGGLVEGQLPIRQVLDILKPLLEHPSILKIGQNTKYDISILARYGITMAPIDDTMLISYALDGARYNGMDVLADAWLGHKCISFSELAGTGKAQKTFDQLEIAPAARYAAEDADITLRLWHVLKPRLVAENATTLYETLERPLAPVLSRMESRGISVDRAILSRLSGDFSQRAAALEAEAHELAGATFNLGSPKQLGEILFDKMQLPGGTKTKTGAWATGADVLEDLALKGIPLARTIVDWRQLTKLKGTYTDALPAHINARTGPRAHLILASRRADWAHFLQRAQPAEHPRPHRGWPQDPQRLRRRSRQDFDQRRLFPDRAARAGPYRRYPGAQGRLRGGPRHSRHDRVRNVRRPGRGHALRRAPPRQGDQFRHHLRHFRLRPRQPARHRPHRGGRLHQDLFRALPRHQGLHGRTAPPREDRGPRHHPVRPQDPVPQRQFQQPRRTQLRRTRLHQRPHPGQLPPTSSAAP